MAHMCMGHFKKWMSHGTPRRRRACAAEASCCSKRRSGISQVSCQVSFVGFVCRSLLQVSFAGLFCRIRLQVSFTGLFWCVQSVLTHWRGSSKCTIEKIQRYLSRIIQGLFCRSLLQVSFRVYRSLFRSSRGVLIEKAQRYPSERWGAGVEYHFQEI